MSNKRQKVFLVTIGDLSHYGCGNYYLVCGADEKEIEKVNGTRTRPCKILEELGPPRELLKKLLSGELIHTGSWEDS